MAGTPLFNPNDGLTGRNGGPYLDEVQAQQDEIRRAAIEQREPNLDNPGANAGIQLSTAAQMLATLSVQNNPSMEHLTTGIVAEAKGKAEGDVLVSPVFDERPDTSDQPTIDDLDKVTYNSEDPNAPSSETEGTEGNDETGEPATPAVDLVTPDEPDLGTPSESVKTDGEVTGDSTNVPS